MKYWMIAAARILLKAALFAIFVAGCLMLLVALFEHFPHVTAAVYAVSMALTFVYAFGFILYDLLSYEHEKVVNEMKRRGGK